MAKQNNVNKNKKAYEELLESDDEFPMDYNDVLWTPAYKDDSRFDMIEFKWIKDPKTYNFRTSPTTIEDDSSTSLETSSYATESIDETVNSSNENTLIRGVLSYYDLFCLKSIEGLISDATLLWFVKFLEDKDLQSSNKYVRSCLVSQSLVSEEYKNSLSKEIKHNSYKVVIKV